MKIKIRNITIILIILVININAFATSVSDNDGSAFITKAEFDALKNNFQSQIDSYNRSIDSKIDSAIASYLANIKINQERDGINIIKNMNNSRQVRFYNYSTNTFKTSTLANLKIKYLWRLFGCFYLSNFMRYPETDSRFFLKDNYIEGSFLQDLFSNTHYRGFIMSEKGNNTNYQYQTTKYTYSGDTYYALDEPQSKTFQCTVGAYYYYLGSQVKWTDGTIPDTWVHKARDVEIPFTTNTIQPGNMDYDLGFKTVTANGASWNIWKKTNNVIDCDFVYDFTNTTYDESKNILVYNIDDFSNWTVQDTLSYGRNGVDSDFWFSFCGEGKDGGYRRSYAYITSTNPTNTNIAGTIEPKMSTMKYYRPQIDSITTGKLINANASAQIEKAVKPYHGAPFTKMQANATQMTAKLKVKIYDSTDALVPNAAYHILLRNKPFDNTSSSTYVSGSDSTIKKWNVSAGSENYNIELDETYLGTMNDGDVMYMRVMPATAGYHADVDCEEIKFKLEG